MILDLSLPRRDYFRRWSAHQILHQFVPKERVTLRNVQALDEAGKVVVVSAEEDLEALLQKKELHQDNTKMVHQVNTAKRDEVLVFAPSYRIPAGDSRRLIAYSYSSLLPLDRFKDKHKKASKVLEEAFGYLHQHPERFLDKTLLGWSWQGWEDRLLRVVPLMNDIKGQELRAFQNVRTRTAITRYRLHSLDVGWLSPRPPITSPRALRPAAGSRAPGLAARRGFRYFTAGPSEIGCR